MSAIAAEFVDFKLVKTRSVAQLVFEVPVEQADEILDFLGGVPKPGHAAWVGMARLSPPEQEKPKAQHPLVTRAVMLCKDPRFQEWLEVANENMARDLLVAECGIKSRAELGTNEIAANTFRNMEAAFKAQTGQMAERR